jgi:hypothetical protein
MCVAGEVRGGKREKREEGGRREVGGGPVSVIKVIL